MTTNAERTERVLRALDTYVDGFNTGYETACIRIAEDLRRALADSTYDPHGPGEGCEQCDVWHAAIAIVVSHSVLLKKEEDK